MKLNIRLLLLLLLSLSLCMHSAHGQTVNGTDNSTTLPITPPTPKPAPPKFLIELETMFKNISQMSISAADVQVGVSFYVYQLMNEAALYNVNNCLYFA